MEDRVRCEGRKGTRPTLIDQSPADLRFLNERIATSENPRQFGDALVGPLSEYWKFRVGDYRVIATINDRTVTVYVVRIGNRREVYR